MGNVPVCNVCASTRRDQPYDVYISYHHGDESQHHKQSQLTVPAKESPSKLLKNRLREYDHMLTCFLDVDDLDDVTKVDDHVDRCNCMIVFCSGTYFNSKNCMGELRRAVERGKPLVALLDVNASAESPAQLVEAIKLHADGATLAKALFSQKAIGWDRTKRPLELSDATLGLVISRLPMRKHGV